MRGLSSDNAGHEETPNFGARLRCIHDRDYLRNLVIAGLPRNLETHS